MKKDVGIWIIILGIIACIMFFVAGTQMSSSASNMQTLRSESGDSVAEVYYQNMGKEFEGLGIFSDAFGITILIIALGMGTYLINSDKKNKIDKNVDNKEKRKAEDEFNKLGL